MSTDEQGDKIRTLALLLEHFAPIWPSLPDKPEENAESAIRALWFAAAGSSRSVEKARLGELPPWDEHLRSRLHAMIERRISGVPLAHLLGWQQFMGLEFKAGPQALIPRKETEILGHAA